MGHVWKKARNVVVGGLVHEAYRDVAKGAEQGRVHVFCESCFFYTSPKRGHTIAKPTSKRITCLQCMSVP